MNLLMNINHHNQGFSLCTVVDLIIFQSDLVLDHRKRHERPSLENIRPSSQDPKQSPNKSKQDPNEPYHDPGELNQDPDEAVMNQQDDHVYGKCGELENPSQCY